MFSEGEIVKLSMESGWTAPRIGGCETVQPATSCPSFVVLIGGTTGAGPSCSRFFSGLFDRYIGNAASNKALVRHFRTLPPYALRESISTLFVLIPYMVLKMILTDI